MAGTPNANTPIQFRGALQTRGVTFRINDAKFNVPVVTLSINDNINFLKMEREDLKEELLGKNIVLK